MEGRGEDSVVKRWKGGNVLLRFVDEALPTVWGRLEEVSELGVVLSHPEGYRGVKYDQWEPGAANMGMTAPGHEEFYRWPTIAGMRPIDDWDLIEDQRPD